MMARAEVHMAGDRPRADIKAPPGDFAVGPRTVNRVQAGPRRLSGTKLPLVEYDLWRGKTNRFSGLSVDLGRNELHAFATRQIAMMSLERSNKGIASVTMPEKTAIVVIKRG